LFRIADLAFSRIEKLQNAIDIQNSLARHIFVVVEMMIFGLVVALFPFATSSHYINGKRFLYRYVYTGYSFSPSFPYGASWEAEIVRKYVGGRSTYILYDNNRITDYNWKKF
jgi:hypothetical protein